MKRVCHRFLPIDRYNRYQSNQIYRFSLIYQLTNRYRFLSIDYSGINFSFALRKVIWCSWGKQITEISWGEIIDASYIKLAFCLALPTDKIIVPTKRVKKKSGTRIINTVDLVITLIARF